MHDYLQCQIQWVGTVGPCYIMCARGMQWLQYSDYMATIKLPNKEVYPFSAVYAWNELESFIVSGFVHGQILVPDDT